jgi:hypothetical protein
MEPIFTEERKSRIRLLEKKMEWLGRRYDGALGGLRDAGKVVEAHGQRMILNAISSPNSDQMWYLSGEIERTQKELLRLRMPKPTWWNKAERTVVIARLADAWAWERNRRYLEDGLQRRRLDLLATIATAPSETLSCHADEILDVWSDPIWMGDEER